MVVEVDNPLSYNLEIELVWNPDDGIVTRSLAQRQSMVVPPGRHLLPFAPAGGGDGSFSAHLFVEEEHWGLFGLGDIGKGLREMDSKGLEYITICESGCRRDCGSENWIGMAGEYNVHAGELYDVSWASLTSRQKCTGGICDQINLSAVTTQTICVGGGLGAGLPFSLSIAIGPVVCMNVPCKEDFTGVSTGFSGGFDINVFSVGGGVSYSEPSLSTCVVLTPAGIGLPRAYFDVEECFTAIGG